jgi:hypothetical protein
MNYVEQTCSRKDGATHEKLFRKILCGEIRNGGACTDFAQVELRHSPEALTLIIGRGCIGLAYSPNPVAGSIEMVAVLGTLKLKIRPEREGGFMATQKQRAAARKNIKKAAKAAKRKQTLKHLPKKTRRALGQQAAKVRQSRR